MAAKSIIISGKRKTAVAKLRMKPGDGNVIYNFVSYEELNMFHRLALAEPLRIFKQTLGDELKHDFFVKTSGGGKEAQIQAARLAIAKALLHITASDVLRKAFIAYDRNMVVPDSRRKETKKPGDSSARANRQTSYR